MVERREGMSKKKGELEGFKHRMYENNKYDVIHIEVVGSITPEGYMAINKRYSTWETGKPEKVIIDLSETDMSSMVPWDRPIRKKVKDSTEQFSPNAKVAVIGADTSAISQLVMKITLNILGAIKTSKFFDNVEEALAWLEGEIK
ncbi:hypothetical protein GF338_09740 [candidate division WOR-3 bacterium]|nr:hypothetical protein [candidate division WOR-3 bacterium]